MADSKISVLAALTGANVDPAADVMEIVDTSVTTSKKILVQELFNALTTLTADAAPDNTADYMLTFDTSTATAKKVLLNLVGASTKVGTFTRAQDGGSAGVSYTGIGFQPRAVIFIMAINGQVGRMSIGFDAGNLAVCVSDNYNSTANTWGAVASGVSIRSVDSPTDIQSGSIASLDADGFTITWIKTNTPSALTMTVHYIAIR